MTIERVYFEMDDADLPHIINLKAFGAKGDGITDDAEAVKAAICYFQEMAALRDKLALAIAEKEENKAFAEMFYQKQMGAEIKQKNAEKRLAAAEQRYEELAKLFLECTGEDEGGHYYFGQDLWNRIQKTIKTIKFGESE
jgi:hypothetical protein